VSREWPVLSYEQWSETCDTLHADATLLPEAASCLRGLRLGSSARRQRRKQATADRVGPQDVLSGVLRRYIVCYTVWYSVRCTNGR